MPFEAGDGHTVEVLAGPVVGGDLRRGEPIRRRRATPAQIGFLGVERGGGTVRSSAAVIGRARLAARAAAACSSANSASRCGLLLERDELLVVEARRAGRSAWRSGASAPPPRVGR